MRHPSPSAHIEARLTASLPKLAWLAEWIPSDSLVRVLHGRGVETTESFVVEGVWDGPFAAGDFHRCEHFFGSGVLVRDGCVYFVPSCALVDRLFYCEVATGILVSNSLALLLGFTGAELDPDHDYRSETYAVLKGSDEYDRTFHVLHPTIDHFVQLYADILAIDSRGVRVERRPRATAITTFHDYEERVTQSLARIRDNSIDPARTSRLDSFATISAGYDSPAVAALVRHVGVQTVFTSTRSNSGIPRWVSRAAAVDDGGPIADLLGLVTVRLDSSRAALDDDEIFYYAPSCAEPELVFFPMARYIERNCDSAVVFTGFHGDKMWDVNLSPKYQSVSIRRGDVSGVALSEARLKSGFIHAAVPFMYARNVADLVAISRSEEMRTWRVGGDYDRPIPRRILEEAGVPRAAFGTRKKAVVRRCELPRTAALRREYLANLQQRFGVTRVFLAAHRLLNRGVVSAQRVIEHLGGPRGGDRKVVVWRHIDQSYLLFEWSLSTLSQRLGSAVRAEVVAGSRDSMRRSTLSSVRGTDVAPERD